MEEFASLGMLVKEHSLTALSELGLDLEDSFSFQHHRQDEAGPGVRRVVVGHELPKEAFRSVLLDGVRGVGDGRVVLALPVGNESLSIHSPLAVLIFPAFLANIEAVIALLHVKQQGVKRLLVGERLVARLAPMGAGLDIPIDHAG